MPEIADNLKTVRERIAAAARRSGRTSEDIALVVVTKTLATGRVKEALAAGVTDIGENYVQEAIEKWREIGPSVRWHFIGHLQRNKAKQAVEVFDLIQGVDGLALAEELGKRALAAGKTQDVLVEVNVAGEDTKFGIAQPDVLEMVSRIAAVDGLRVQGLMGMAPFVDDPETTRPYFAELKATWDKLPAENRRFLSMGMTQDFEIAIEEGANMVRIGTAIFGLRKIA